jgi:hypothetical protein
MACIYRHIRLDKNEPFYIGIGKDTKRAFYKLRRNGLWNNIVAKSEYEVEILMEDISYQEALKKEKEFISLYGRIDKKTGTLANLTDGGEGTIGAIRTEEYRKNVSKSLTGRKIPIEVIEKRSKTNKGRVFSEERNKKISEAKKGVKRPYMQYGKHINAIKICNSVTGECYSSMKEAAEKNGIKYTTLSGILHGAQKNKTNLYILR